MALNYVKNPRDLKDLILRRLGAPVIQIEITEDQIYDSIGRALELYKEYHHDALNKAYITVKMDKTQAESGYIDLSHYPIFAISKIIRQKSLLWGGLGGGATLNFMTTLGGGPQGISYHGPFGALGNIGFFAQFNSYQNLMMDQLDPLPDYWLDPINGILQLTGNFREGDLVIMEVHVQNFVEIERSVQGIAGSNGRAGSSKDPASIAEMWVDPFKRLPKNLAGQKRSEFPDQGVLNVRWVKDYSTTLVKEVWGQILAKHQGMALPGGVTIDGQRLIEEARMEKETLRQELLLLEEPLPIIMG